MDEILAFVIAGLALAGSPGPATMSLAATGAAFGARRGIAYMSGIVIGMVAVMGITATGLGGLMLALPGAAPIATLLATLYFAYLALRIATAPPLSDTGRQRNRPSFPGGIFLSLVNPKGYAAMAALFSTFVLVRERFELDVAVKMLILTAIITVVNIAWLLTGETLTRFFRKPRTNRIINVTFAVLLLVSVILALSL